MTEADLIGGILEREGGWRDEVRRPNGTIDPATNKGITFQTLIAWRQNHGLPTPTLDDLRMLSDDEAAQIYREEYVRHPGFTPENIPFEPLRVQLIDFGVNSDPARAIRWLQRVLRVPVTGRLDGRTMSKLRALNLVKDQSLLPLVNDALVAARSYMIDRAVDSGAMRKQDEEGVESRALSFFLATYSLSER